MIEPQAIDATNQPQIDQYVKKGPVRMGPWASWMWRSDPRHLLFTLSRYKFCAKALEGREYVLEVGCGDGFAIPIMLQTVKSVHGVDFEPIVIEAVDQVMDSEFRERCKFSVLDMTKPAASAVFQQRKFDAAYTLDVFEHIPSSKEDIFLKNIADALISDGVCIIGVPNIEASRFATPLSAAGHINLKSASSLKQLLLKYFSNVLIFSMNDEVVHTGYHGMAHYIFAVCTGPR